MKRTSTVGTAAVSKLIGIALFGAGLVLIPSTIGAAAAADRVFKAKYGIEAFGLRIGSLRLAISLSDYSYATEVTGKVSGVAKLVTDGGGKLGATGALIGGSLQPAAFTLKVREGKKTSTVDLRFADNRIDEVVMTTEPKKAKKKQKKKQKKKVRAARIPLTDEHKENVLDPLSALVAAMTDAASSETPCDLEVPVFTGDERFNIELFPIRVTQYSSDRIGYSGPVYECGISYEPIAGHRPDSKNVKFHLNQQNRAWLARVDENLALMVPVLVKLNLRPGTVTAKLRNFRTE